MVAPPKPKVRDLTKCATKVYGSLEGTARWQGSRQCGNPIAVKSVRPDGTTIACYCKKHNPAGVAGLVVEAL